MPTWVTCGGTAVPASFTVTTAAGTASIWDTSSATTSSTSSTIIWINIATTATGTSLMSHPGFDTSTTYYHHQLALQQAAMLNNAYSNQPQFAQIVEHNLRHDEARLAALRREEEARLARYEEEDRARRRTIAQARARAKELLLEHLTDEQRATIERHGWFIVEGGKSRRRYRIRTDRGAAGNVERLGADGNADECFCGHSRYVMIPDYDDFLAQKLMLEADEDGYRALANRRAVR